MVSLWPWNADKTSAASFEKALSALSSKINKANVHGDRLNSRARRFKALWTLYTIFAYILCCLILFLVTGHSNWTAVEYAAVGVSPFLIYTVRLAISTYFNYRILNSQTYLDDLNQQKETVIQKLKEATKYNSTQELLDKYGGSPKEAKLVTTPISGKKRQSGAKLINTQPSRTNLPPPPTANIPRLSENVVPEAPGSVPRILTSEGLATSYTASPNATRGSISASSPTQAFDADFAPNAFERSTQYAAASSGQSKWYDRIVDVLLGEDETRAANRLALICSHCRLVNGQAPPGTKRLEDVGRWRCSNCKGWNGEAPGAEGVVAQVAKNEEKRGSSVEVTSQVEERSVSREPSPTPSVSESIRQQNQTPDIVARRRTRQSGGTDLSTNPEPSEVDYDSTPPALSTRSRKKKGL